VVASIINERDTRSTDLLKTTWRWPGDGLRRGMRPTAVVVIRRWSGTPIFRKTHAPVESARHNERNKGLIDRRETFGSVCLALPRGNAFHEQNKEVS